MNLGENFKKQYDDFLAEVANLYYNENKTQSEIAKQYDTTRFKIAKYLQEARDKNIVTIEIRHPETRAKDLEYKLKENFNLKEAIVLKVNNNDIIDISQSIGKSAAEYIESVLKKNSIVGLTWGKTLYQAIKNIKPNKNGLITVVQPFGTFGKRNVTMDTPSLIHILTDKYNANCRFLYAPLYIMDDTVRKNLAVETIINQTFLKIQKMDVLLTGLGTTEAVYSTWIWDEFLEQNEINTREAVGVLYGRLYDKNGKFLDIPLNKKVFGADLDLIKSVKNKICIVTGKFKAAATLAALKGHLIDSLITDELTATKILYLGNIL